jgi:hypothetical protein
MSAQDRVPRSAAHVPDTCPRGAFRARAALGGVQRRPNRGTAAWMTALGASLQINKDLRGNTSFKQGILDLVDCTDVG